MRIWLLRDVFVAFEGLVFDDAGRLFAPSVTQHHHSEIEWARQQVVAARDSGLAPRIDGPVILGSKRGAHNFGHWLIEMLPMLHFARERIQSGSLGVLVHNVTEPQLGGVMLHSLRRLGVPDTMVRVADVEPVRAERLLLVEGLTTHGVYMSPLIAPAIDSLMRDIPGEGHERVFIRRGRGMRRDFANPAHVEALARMHGFHVLDTEGLSLEQQIAALRDARVVAGAMGAAMTNLVFASPGAEIRMVAGADMPDTFFWFAATVTGRGYKELRCRQADEVQGLPYDRALMPTDAEIHAFLGS
ncbi:glycosyltransferase family 61 protein [Acetobacteraceae bacterium KSS8]|uniref:Glycosyltransferase family 61 protein n=1 Tax=Endosaccharibacter trunci TaxID=2812733 RepID=A0ABT1W4L9_9PROT|nr:glycosyltransferase family 61 protein [Acetobacteraceae bacterium KSS8]